MVRRLNHMVSFNWLAIFNQYSSVSREFSVGVKLKNRIFQSFKVNLKSTHFFWIKNLNVTFAPKLVFANWSDNKIFRDKKRTEETNSPNLVVVCSPVPVLAKSTSNTFNF